MSLYDNGIWKRSVAGRGRGGQRFAVQAAAARVGFFDDGDPGRLWRRNARTRAVGAGLSDHRQCHSRRKHQGRHRASDRRHDLPLNIKTSQKKRGQTPSGQHMSYHPGNPRFARSLGFPELLAAGIPASMGSGARRATGHVALWILVELLLALAGTEVVGLTFVLALASCALLIDVHSAHRISHKSSGMSGCKTPTTTSCCRLTGK